MIYFLNKINLPLLVLFASFGLSACSLSILPESDAKQYFVIEKTELLKKSKKLHFGIRVKSAEAGRLIDSRRILFSPETNRRGQYQYSFWVESPASRLTELLEDGFESSGAFKSVLNESSTKGDFELRTVLRKFYHNTKKRPGQVRVSLSAELINLKTKERISRKKFYLKKESPTYNASGAVQAFTDVSNQVVENVLNWTIETLESRANISSY